MHKQHPDIKKIGLVLSAVPGYSETFFRNKINGLQNNGFEVVLFVDYYKESDIDFPCKVIAASDFNGTSLKTITNAIIAFCKAIFLYPKKSLRLYQLDKKDGESFKERIRNIILSQFLLTEPLDWLHFGFGMLANGRENVAKAIGAKMAVSFRGFDLYLSPLKHPGCYNRLFEKEVHYHVLSEGMKETLKNYQIPINNIQVITPAIDTNFFKKERVTDKSEMLHLITVARLNWKKGLEYTLEALAILKQNGVQFKYTMIGEGDQYERLIFAAYQLGLINHINFEGKLSPSDVKQHLEQADIYLQYSIQEGFCNAVLEAQSMGLLCVVSNAEGLDENVLDTRTGWVVPKRQPQALAQKIIEVVQLSQEEKQRIRQAAINRVHDEFNLELQNTAFYNFYNH